MTLLAFAVTTINWGALIGGIVALLAAVFHGRWGTKQQLDSIAITLDGQLTRAVDDIKTLQNAVAHLEGYLAPSPLTTALVPPVVVAVPVPPPATTPAPPVPPPTA